jgi:tetratricopeptide (TPR) repeat protein
LFVVDSLFPGYPYGTAYSGKLSALEGDYEIARDRFAELMERFGTDLFWRAEVEGLLAATAATEGRLEEYETHMRARTAANEARGLPEEVLSDAIQDAWIQLDARRDTVRARRVVEDALSRYPLSGLAAADRPYLDLADLYATTGSPDRARELVDEYEREVSSRARGARYDLLRSRAQIAIAEGRHEEALDLVRQSDAGGCALCPLPYFVEAYERAGMTDSAIVAHERYLDSRFLDRVYWDASLLGHTLERLGELHEATGDLEQAAEYYARFVELWADADEELQPRVRAAQTRLEEIASRRG